MPSKQELMEDYDNASEILEYANTEHGVALKAKYFKKEANGQITVAVCLVAEPSTIFEGTGSTNKEAVADCISQQFPG